MATSLMLFDDIEECPRYKKGWCCQKVELLCSHIRALALEEIEYQFADETHWNEI